jgi:inosose dehydratase
MVLPHTGSMHELESRLVQSGSRSKGLRGNTSRRQILQALGSVGAYGALFPLTSRRSFAQSGHLPVRIRFGVQLNAFPIDPKRFETFTATLEQVKQIGYQGFEAGFRYLSEQFAAPEMARRSIEQSGLTFFGIHIFLPTFEMYDPNTRIAAPSVYEPVARGGAALGAKHLILSGAPAGNADQLKAKIDALNAAGRFALSSGITAAYHNHWWEFQSKIGEIEALYTQTDPELVHFVLDAGHAYHGGADVPAFIRAHSERIIGFHVRDFKNGDYVELGTGDFPLHQVAATIEQIGWKGWVENEEERADHSQTGLHVIAPAYKAMTEAFTS